MSSKGEPEAANIEIAQQDADPADGPSGPANDGSPLPVIAAGDAVGEIQVQIGPQFLELFSEHLYSSPNKAFEELVSNSWDAGATCVHIGMSDDLQASDASVWVLDNGVSMDITGLEALWAVATSQKRKSGPQSNRPQIGKFGIGKLATYILANCLTYVCKAEDGVVRAVTMDYRRIDMQPGVLHIDPLPLEVRELDEEQLEELLTSVDSSVDLVRLISEDVPPPAADAGYENEYGGPDISIDSGQSTWTLAILTSLKEAGESMEQWHIKRMLRYALPLGASMRIAFNGDPLESMKIKTDLADEWVLGKNLGISELPPEPPIDDSAEDEEEESPIPITEVGPSTGSNGSDATEPHIFIEGIEGPIYGRVRLYEERISGGKSEALGSSNGFFINVLGRVINVEDPYFGLENLNHSAWAKFRATVRADGLDRFLAVNREGTLESDSLHLFRRFLFAIFNKARSAHDSRTRAAWPNVGEVLTDSWGTVPLQALRQVVKDGLANDDLPPFINSDGADQQAEAELFDGMSTDAVDEVISAVVLEDRGADEPFVQYDLATHRVVVNSQHPFAIEHGDTHEQQLLLRDAALVDLLTQAFMADAGISNDLLGQISEYRDQTFRLIAQRRRRNGIQLAALLVEATSYDKGLERIVGDALEFLGFKVRRLGQPGKTEGVASAPAAAQDSDLAESYSFTYDAKSSEKGKVKTGNVGVAGLVRHREDESADHTLVIAPDFEAGALEQECETNSITPMRAKDLSRLLILAATRGPINLTGFREIFELHGPADVDEWVDSFIAETEKEPMLRYDELLEALESIGHAGPDAITTSVLAKEVRALRDDDQFPTRHQVSAVMQGLEVLLPNVVRVVGDNVYIGTSPSKLRDAIRKQLGSVPDEFQTDVEQPSPDPAAP
jgi:Histidine kinase-, DNA gyrase B-, and HSP90-like ATPase